MQQNISKYIAASVDNPPLHSPYSHSRICWYSPIYEGVTRTRKRSYAGGKARKERVQSTFSGWVISGVGKGSLSGFAGFSCGQVGFGARGKKCRCIPLDNRS